MFFKEILCTFFSSRSQELKKKKFFGKPDSFFSIHWKLLMMMMMMANIEEKNIQVMIGKKNNFQSSLNDFVCVCVWVFACWFIIIGIIFFFFIQIFFSCFSMNNNNKIRNDCYIIITEWYITKWFMWKKFESEKWSLSVVLRANFFFFFFWNHICVFFFCFRLFSFTMNNIKATKKKFT